jgi:hypothetical protein
MAWSPQARAAAAEARRLNRSWKNHLANEKVKGRENQAALKKKGYRLAPGKGIKGREGARAYTKGRRMVYVSGSLVTKARR